MRTRIKICGLRTLGAVLACKKAGADAVGFVFYPPSPRAISAGKAGPLAKHLGAWQTPVGLFVNPSVAEVLQVIDQIPQVLLQFHGDETPEFCESFNRPYIKAIRIKGDTDILTESKRFQSAQALLLDSWSESYGGSGHTFDWSLLPQANVMSQALVLSGGLDSNNVGSAIQNFSVYGVDVSSGVESSRGVKCESRITAFCKAVLLADFKALSTHVEE